jgi:hypothetical protein
MRSANDIAVYNSRIPHMRSLAPRFSRAACLVVLILMRAPIMLASDWRAPEEQLARKIAAATGPGPAALDVVNRSSLGRAEAEEIRREFLAELAALGVLLVNTNQTVATVRITFSENLQSYVWVAEIHRGNDEPLVVMVATPREIRVAEGHPAAAVTIQKTLLWTDETRILDVVLVNSNPQRMIVLEPESALLFRFQDGRAQQEQSLPLSHSHPWPRDLRGRLVLRKDHLFDAYLPGVFCRSSTTAPVGLNCFESEDPWPLGTDHSGLSAFFAPSRNFFTGALSPGIEQQATVGAFYSAAMLPRDKFLFAAVDGQVHMLDGMTNQTLERVDWGSDIASVQSGCGQGWQVLATGNGGGGVETVRAFEVADRETVAVSQPAEFNGSITALWAEPDGAGVIAVSQNSETDGYEAYRLSIICGQ